MDENQIPVVLRTILGVISTVEIGLASYIGSDNVTMNRAKQGPAILLTR